LANPLVGKQRLRMFVAKRSDHSQNIPYTGMRSRSAFLRQADRKTASILPYSGVTVPAWGTTERARGR
jgi:hypothetical protein